MIDLKYNNIVYSGVYSIKLNLNILESRLLNVIKKKTVLIWKYRRLPMTCMIYGSGKLNMMGNPNTDLADMDECRRFGHTTLRSVARIIQSKIGRGQLLNVKLE